MHDATWCQKLEADLVTQKTMGISEKVQFGILSMQEQLRCFRVEHLSRYFKISTQLSYSTLG